MMSKTPSKKEIFGGSKPFRLGIFSSSGSGKSYLIREILLNREFGLDQKFKPQNVFIICPTLKLDDTYEDVIQHLEDRSTQKNKFDKQKQCFSDSLEQNLVNTYKHIFEQQQGLKINKQKPDPFLIILDDIALEINTQQQSNEITRILTKIRHLNASIIISLQHYKNLSSMGRNQLSHIVIFNMSLADEIQKVSNEVRGTLKKNIFSQIYTVATRPEYGYLLIITSLPVQYRFFIGQGSKIQQIELDE